MPTPAIDEKIRIAQFELFSGLVRDSLDADWYRMLLRLQADVTIEGVTYLGFMNAPAAKGNHHAYKGGLVDHLTDMWNIYCRLKDTSSTYPGRLVTDDYVLKGIIIHDLHKAWATFVEDPSIDSGVNYGSHPSNYMMTDNQKSTYILMQAGIKLDVVETNVLNNSEGGWAKSPPKWCTTVAKLVYLLDDMSGNVVARSTEGNELDLRSKLRYDKELFELKLEG